MAPPAKGNTLLNYCGIGPELIDFAVDRNPYKQGKFLPGTRIPVRAPEQIFDTARLCADPALEIQEEITAQMAAVRDWADVLFAIAGAYARPAVIFESITARPAPMEIDPDRRGRTRGFRPRSAPRTFGAHGLFTPASSSQRVVQ